MAIWIIYDGECAFCRSQVAAIRRRDRAGQFAYLPYQAPEVEERFPQLAGVDLSSGLRVVEPDGRVQASADAVYAIARRLPRWRRIAWVYRVPGVHWFAPVAYHWVARHRHQIGGSCENGACRVPNSPGR